MWRTEKKFRTGDTFSVYYKFPDGFVAEGKIEIYGPTKINTSEVSGTLWRYSTTEGRFFSDKSFGVVFLSFETQGGSNIYVLPLDDLASGPKGPVRYKKLKRAKVSTRAKKLKKEKRKGSYNKGTAINVKKNRKTVLTIILKDYPYVLEKGSDQFYWLADVISFGKFSGFAISSDLDTLVHFDGKKIWVASSGDGKDLGPFSYVVDENLTRVESNPEEDSMKCKLCSAEIGTKKDIIKKKMVVCPGCGAEWRYQPPVSRYSTKAAKAKDAWRRSRGKKYEGFVSTHRRERTEENPCGTRENPSADLATEKRLGWVIRCTNPHATPSEMYFVGVSSDDRIAFTPVEFEAAMYVNDTSAANVARDLAENFNDQGIFEIDLEVIPSYLTSPYGRRVRTNPDVKSAYSWMKKYARRNYNADTVSTEMLGRAYNSRVLKESRTPDWVYDVAETVVDGMIEKAAPRRRRKSRSERFKRRRGW